MLSATVPRKRGQKQKSYHYHSHKSHTLPTGIPYDSSPQPLSTRHFAASESDLLFSLKLAQSDAFIYLLFEHQSSESRTPGDRQLVETRSDKADTLTFLLFSFLFSFSQGTPSQGTGTSGDWALSPLRGSGIGNWLKLKITLKTSSIHTEATTRRSGSPAVSPQVNAAAEIDTSVS